MTVGIRIAVLVDYVLSVSWTHYAPYTKEEKIMNIFIFIIDILILLCGILCVIVILAKNDNIKQLDFHISLKDGISFKSLFYKR